MREQIRKPIKNEDLYEGCAEAFGGGGGRSSFTSCAACPASGQADLDGIIEMAETIARIGKEVTGRHAEVTAAVSNFVPKPHTPYQWNGMRPREYFHWAHRYLRSRVRLRSVTVKFHDIERSLLKGILTRGDRRVGAGGRGGLAARGSARRLDRAFRLRALVEDLRRSGHRRAVLQRARAAGRRGSSLGPYSHQVRPRLPCQGAEPVGRPARIHGRSGMSRGTLFTRSWSQHHGNRFPTKLMTAEEFMDADLGEGSFELVRGR